MYFEHIIDSKCVEKEPWSLEGLELENEEEISLVKIWQCLRVAELVHSFGKSHFASRSGHRPFCLKKYFGDQNLNTSPRRDLPSDNNFFYLFSCLTI